DRAPVGALRASRDSEDSRLRRKDGQEVGRGLLPLGRGEAGCRGETRRGSGAEAMSVPDRRGLNLGIVLLAIGVFFLLRRELHFRGPGPILLLLGALFLAASVLRGFRGPTVPAGVLLGLGAG